MSVVIITGSGGLVGSEAVQFFHDAGFDVIGIDNDMRSSFFGPDSSTAWRSNELANTLKNFKLEQIDIRDKDSLNSIFSYGKSITAIIHCAAQPSHDWAASNPEIDFTINALGTLYLLEAARKFSPDAVFINLSTNKVYGDTPNTLPLIEEATRWSLAPAHEYAEFGIPETMSIDKSTHSLFGVSKTSADLLTQEYGKYFGMQTVTFRGGCLTGPSHSGAPLHGFLAYLVRCAITKNPYIILGYKGKQVRDNIHSADLVSAFWQVINKPISGEVFNIGGSQISNTSVIEAIEKIQELTGEEMLISYDESPRVGDHIWYVSDIRKFKSFYPEWEITKNTTEILSEMIDSQSDRISKANNC